MSVRYPRVLIVSAPTATRTVLYDFNDDTQPVYSGSKTEISAAEWSFGQLDLQGDPDAVGVEWALQRISFQQTITGSKPEALARQRDMSRALLARRFWVEFQLNESTKPVWWHAYRTPPGELSLEQVYVNSQLADRWVIAGGIDVVAFSHAARVKHPTKTVGNNPANDATTPSGGYALPGIKGDALSRLRVTLNYPAGVSPLNRLLVANVASSRPSPIIRVETDTFTAGGYIDGTPAVRANASGGKVLTGTLAATSSPRISGPLPATGRAPRGRYLVLLRLSVVPSTGAGATLTLHLRNQQAGFGLPVNPLTTPVVAQFPDAVETFQWVALGVIGINDSLPQTEAVESGTRKVSLYIDSTDVAAQVALDCFLMIPVDGPDIHSASTMVVDMLGTGLSSTRPLVIDGDAEMTWVQGADDSENLVMVSGGYPVADPAASNNTLLVLPMIGASSGTASPVDLGKTFLVDVSYHPRSAYIGDGN